MIVSASRRTDIPAFYSDWFLRRLREGFALVRHPMNPKRVYRVALSPETVDCIVFWTKDPRPMLPRLSELAPYPYYFQVTLTPYGAEIEPGLRDKRGILRAVRALAGEIGPERVVWRYDPVLFNARYTPDFHLAVFGKMAAALEGAACRVVLSFVDRYAKMRASAETLGLTDLEAAALRAFAGRIAGLAAAHGMETVSCAEEIDLESVGVRHGACIDRALIERILGERLSGGKDRGQRPACGCMESVDLGTYNTCPNGCAYCYANRSAASTARAAARYDPRSLMLCDALRDGDEVVERAMRRLRTGQKRL